MKQREKLFWSFYSLLFCSFGAIQFFLCGKKNVLVIFFDKEDFDIPLMCSNARFFSSLKIKIYGVRNPMVTQKNY